MNEKGRLEAGSNRRSRKRSLSFFPSVTFSPLRVCVGSCYLYLGDILRGASARSRPVNTSTLAFKITAATITTKKRFVLNRGFSTGEVGKAFAAQQSCSRSSAGSQARGGDGRRTNGWPSMQLLSHTLFVMSSIQQTSKDLFIRGGKAKMENWVITQFLKLYNCVIVLYTHRACAD